MVELFKSSFRWRKNKIKYFACWWRTNALQGIFAIIPYIANEMQNTRFMEESDLSKNATTNIDLLISLNGRNVISNNFYVCNFSEKSSFRLSLFCSTFVLFYSVRFGIEQRRQIKRCSWTQYLRFFDRSVRASNARRGVQRFLRTKRVKLTGLGGLCGEACF